jgi:hypothetical protein
MILHVFEGRAPAPEQDNRPPQSQAARKSGVNLRVLFAIYAMAALATALGVNWALILRRN